MQIPLNKKAFDTSKVDRAIRSSIDYSFLKRCGFLGHYMDHKVNHAMDTKMISKNKARTLEKFILLPMTKTKNMMDE